MSAQLQRTGMPSSPSPTARRSDRRRLAGDAGPLPSLDAYPGAQRADHALLSVEERLGSLVTTLPPSLTAAMEALWHSRIRTDRCFIHYTRQNTRVLKTNISMLKEPAPRWGLARKTRRILLLANVDRPAHVHLAVGALLLSLIVCIACPSGLSGLHPCSSFTVQTARNSIPGASPVRYLISYAYFSFAVEEPYCPTHSADLQPASLLPARLPSLPPPSHVRSNQRRTQSRNSYGLIAGRRYKACPFDFIERRAQVAVSCTPYRKS
ncbi:hypothetical protein PTI98_010560 [Pleurotus ostreatus]|nr:hypothetical protein PTI98_010560 [Pleurotus ostreatus]